VFVLEETDRLIAALEPLAQEWRAEKGRRQSLEYRQSLELLRAIRLAPRLEICEAILRGERVPRSMLASDWLEAYGL
jgi:hypothetical protein